MEVLLKDVKKIWLTGDAIFIKLVCGQTGKELFADYSRLKNATQKQREQYTTSEFGLYWPALDEDLSFSGFFEEKDVSDIGKVFSGITEINVSALARKMGIAQPLMADYISGKKKPGKQRKKELEQSLHELGNTLLNVKF